MRAPGRRVAAAAVAVIPLLAASVVTQERTAAPMPNTIAGRVTAPDGHPISGAVVTPVERSTLRGHTRFHPADVRIHAVTDANGAYRLERVRLGEFYVVAIPQNAAVTPENKPNRLGYTVTYYPSARRVQDARPVLVNVREPQTADIVLQATPLFVITGTVVTSDGSHPAGGLLAVAHGDNLFGVDGKGYRLRPDGGFAIAGIPPGTYFLHYREGVWPPPPSVETPLISGAKVVIENADARDIRVVPIRMVRGSGSLVIADADRRFLQRDGVTVSASPVNSDGNPGPQRAGKVQDDLTFSLRTWPGQAWIRVFPEDAWRVTRVRLNAVDVTETGVDFKEGTDITGLKVEVVHIGR